MKNAQVRVVLDPDASGAERLAVWRDAVKMIGEASVEDPERFTAEASFRSLGLMVMVQFRCSTWSVFRDLDVAAARMMREHVIVQVIQAGAFVGAIAGRRVRAGPGDVVLLQSSNRLDLRLEAPATLGLLIPRPIFEQRQPWAARHDGAVLRAGSVHAGVLGGLVRALAELPGELSFAEAQHAAVSAVATLASCLDEGARPNASAPAGGEVRAEAVRRYVLDHLSDPQLSVETVAREFGVSRSELYRLMGESSPLATIIRRLRLQAAARDLQGAVEKEATVADIGRRWGFVDERSFRRAFRREFGRAPSDARDGAPLEGAAGPVESILQSWLL